MAMGRDWYKPLRNRRSCEIPYFFDERGNFSALGRHNSISSFLRHNFLKCIMQLKSMAMKMQFATFSVPNVHKSPTDSFPETLIGLVMISLARGCHDRPKLELFADSNHSTTLSELY